MDTATQNKSIADATAIWAITANGVRVAENLSQNLDSCHVFILEKYESGRKSKDLNISYFRSLSKAVAESFFEFKQHVFIFSTGIAVRMIAPLIQSKLTDPAVVVVDDTAAFAISLLSGHLGGANTLAKTIAELLGATAVITTATDQNRLPAIDMIAKKLDLHIETPGNIKRINASFLSGKKILILDDTGMLENEINASLRESLKTRELEKVDVYCSPWETRVSRETTLILRPKVLYVGIGCNRGTSKKQIMDFLTATLKNEKLSIKSIAAIATAEIKKDEPGITALARQLKVDVDYYSKEQLNGVADIKTPSDMARKHLGINSVCEAAAILSSDDGRLIVTKTKNRDVTVAVAVKK